MPVARRLFVVFVMLTTICGVYAQDADQERSGRLAVDLLPAAHIPAVPYMGLGPAAQAVGRYQLGSLPLYAEVAAGFARTASVGVATAADLTTFSATAGAGVGITALPFADLRIGGRIGYAVASLTDGGTPTTMGGLMWSALAAVDVPLFAGLSVVAQASLTAHLITHFSYEAGLGVSYRFGGSPAEPRTPRRDRPQPLVTQAQEDPEPEDAEAQTDVAVEPDPAAPVLTERVEYTREDLQLLEAGFATVFPVFYRFYNDNPVGSAVLRNTGRRTLENVELSVNIPRFMDLPQRQTVPGSIEPGEEVQLDLSVLFNDDLLAVTEGTKVAAQINVSWEERGTAESYSVNTTLSVANRNAMTWDDDRKAASFVTAKDPAILGFSKTVAGIVRVGGRTVVNTNLRTAMALLEALNLYGIRYVVDPTTPYAEFSENAQVIDFLQFPVQTFQYGAGDCDDLSICYTANLEAAGVPAAFITIPGHIFTAFNTGVPESAVAASFPRPDEVIIHNGEAWIPVEVTILDDGFVQAWQTGARQWREHASRDQAELIPIQTAWQAFEPIGFDQEQRPVIQAPAEADLLRAYITQLEAYVTASIEPQVARIQRQMDAQNPSARQYNRLGVLYARYEMTDQARDALQRAVEIEPYAPAYLNLGHLRYLEEDYLGALDFYEQAEQLDPDDDAVVLAIARAHHELENYGFAITYYQTLQGANPELAERFAYLESRTAESGRASDAAEMDTLIIWGENEE